MARSTATAAWEGDLLEGRGTVTTASPALASTAVTWKARTGGEAGTTPEELLGAAHAACYSMALSGMIMKDGATARSISTAAAVEFGEGDDGWAVRSIVLTVDVDVPGLEVARVEQLANDAKAGCPISRALDASVEVELQLRQVVSA